MKEVKPRTVADRVSLCSDASGATNRDGAQRDQATTSENQHQKKNYDDQADQEYDADCTA